MKTLSETMHECVRRICACNQVVWECRCKNTHKREDHVKVCQACQITLPPPKRPVPLVKWTIEACLSEEALAALTLDQADVLRDSIVKAMFSHVNGVVAGVNYTHAHLGVHVALKKER